MKKGALFLILFAIFLAACSTDEEETQSMQYEMADLLEFAMERRQNHFAEGYGISPDIYTQDDALAAALALARRGLAV